jgi:hypothetical protein
MQLEINSCTRLSLADAEKLIRLSEQLRAAIRQRRAFKAQIIDVLSSSWGREYVRGLIKQVEPGEHHD